MKTVFLGRSKAAIVLPRSFFREWLIVFLYLGISVFTTVTMADPGREAAEGDDGLASTQYRSTDEFEVLLDGPALRDSNKRFGQALSGSVLPRPTIHLAAPEKAFVQDISIKVLRKAYDKLGYELVVHELPNLRSLMSANNGKYDGEVSRVANLSSIYPNLHPIPTAINVVNVVALAQKNSANIQRVENIRDNPLCVRGNVIVETLVSAHRIECIFVVNISQALAMVSRGRAKYTLLPETNAKISVLHSPVSNVRIVSPVLHSEPLYHYLHKKNLSLVEPLDKVLSEMRSSGSIDQIRSEYFDSIPSPDRMGSDDQRKH